VRPVVDVLGGKVAVVPSVFDESVFGEVRELAGAAAALGQVADVDVGVVDEVAARALVAVAGFVRHASERKAGRSAKRVETR
jgi:hypothetical protein